MPGELTSRRSTTGLRTKTTEEVGEIEREEKGGMEEVEEGAETLILRLYRSQLHNLCVETSWLTKGKWPFKVHSQALRGPSEVN